MAGGAAAPRDLRLRALYALRSRHAARRPAPRRRAPGRGPPVHLHGDRVHDHVELVARRDLRRRHPRPRRAGRRAACAGGGQSRRGLRVGAALPLHDLQHARLPPGHALLCRSAARRALHGGADRAPLRHAQSLRPDPLLLSAAAAERAGAARHRLRLGRSDARHLLLAHRRGVPGGRLSDPAARRSLGRRGQQGAAHAAASTTTSATIRSSRRATSISRPISPW